MATGIMKTESIPFQTGKVEIVETVEELDERIVCKLPVQPPMPELKSAKMTKEYEVKYPSTDVNVHRVRHPLPFPEKLEESIAWTDAFVDHIAKLTAERKKTTIGQLTRLANEIERLGSLLSTTEAALDKSRQDAKAAAKKAQKEIDCLERDLEAEQMTSKNLNDQLKNTNDLLTKESSENKRLTQENKGLKGDIITAEVKYEKAMGDLKKANKDIFDQHKKWDKEQKHHNADHVALAAQEKALKDEQTLRKKAETELGVVRGKFTQAQIEIAAKDRTIASLNTTIAGLQTDIARVENAKEELQNQLAETKKKLDLSEAGLKTANTTIAELVKKADAAKKEIAELDGKLKDAKASNAKLTTEVADVKAEKDAACDRERQLKADLETARKNATDLTEQIKAAKTEAEQLRSELNTTKAQCTDLKNSVQHHVEEKHKAEIAREQAVAARKAAVKAAEEFEQQLMEEQAGQRKERHDLEIDAKIPDAELKELRGLKTKYHDLMVELEATKKKLIPGIPGKRVNILSVGYGGQKYTPTSHKALFDKLYALAESGAEFTVDNKFFGGDPWQWEGKHAEISYQLDGTGKPIHLLAREHDKLKFRLSH